MPRHLTLLNQATATVGVFLRGRCGLRRTRRAKGSFSSSSALTQTRIKLSPVEYHSRRNDATRTVLTQTAVLPGGAFQTTRYVYGVTTASGSAVNSNDVLSAIRYLPRSLSSLRCLTNATLPLSLGTPLATRRLRLRLRKRLSPLPHCYGRGRHVPLCANAIALPLAILLLGLSIGHRRIRVDSATYVEASVCCYCWPA